MTIETEKEHENTIFTEEQFISVSDYLSDLAENLNVSAVFLINSSGHIIARDVKQNWEVDSTLLSTLTASCYSAAKEIANIIGEKTNFKMVLHEGEKFNVFVSSINKNYFLIVLFRSEVAVGMVRLFAKKTIKKLHPVISKSSQNQDSQKEFIDPQFQELLSKELERSLNEI